MSTEPNLDNEWVNYTWVARAKDFSITGASISIKIEGDLINPELDLGGEDSLLEVSAEALITPLIEGLKAIFGEHEERERLTHCAQFRNEITRIQRKAGALSACGLDNTQGQVSDGDVPRSGKGRGLWGINEPKWNPSSFEPALACPALLSR